MNFNRHSELKGRHAVLSPSGVTWLNYDDPSDYFQKFKSQYATVVGTATHEFAEKRINGMYKLNKYEKNDLLMYLTDPDTFHIPRTVIDVDYIYPNLMSYVNDAIGYKMRAEQILCYSENCFGTCDSISFRNNELRIHDLKTGTTPPHMEQLLIYAALFCLEYKVKPGEIATELRIYQGNDIVVFNPSVDDIVPVMDKIVTADKQIAKFREEV